MNTKTALRYFTIIIFVSICNDLTPQDIITTNDIGFERNRSSANFEKPDYSTISAGGLFVGSQNITIPITHIQENGIDIPISLSYNSKGNKVSTIASWVGLGWSLNTGGCITRQVRCIPDDYNCQDYYWDFLNRKNMFPGMLYDQYWIGGAAGTITNNSLNITNDIFNLDLAQNSATNFKLLAGLFSYKADSPIKQKDAKGNNMEITQRDIEPDIFNFNINGKSGQFYFDKNKKIHCIPYFNLKINYVLGTNYIENFTIIDDDGTIYLFNDLEKTVIADKWTTHAWVAGGGGLHFTYNSAWFLSKITTLNGTTINYTYSDESYTYNSPDEYGVTHCSYHPEMRNDEQPYPMPTSSFNITTKRLKNITGTNISIDFNPSSLIRKDLPGPDFNLDGMFTSIPVKPTSAYYSHTSHPVPYTNYLEGAHSLGTIIIKNKGLTGVFNPIKKFDLSYDYFSCYFPQNYKPNYELVDVCETKRLKLCSVTESDANGNTKPPYTLGYNESTNLPARVSHECDLYGYYNANGDYSAHEEDPYVGSYYFHFTPKVYVYDNDNSDSYHVRVLPSSNAQDNLLFTKLGVDLTPNPSTMDAWILNYMSLPTGGSISYDYEPDQGTYVNGGVKEVVTGGGLRLKWMLYDDGVSSTTPIVKSFNYNGSGIVNYMPEYAVFDYSLCGGANSHETINSDLYKNYLYRRSLPYNYFDGPNVVYSKVTVSTTNSGKTDYVFETGNKTNIQNDNVQYCTEEAPGSYVSYYVDAPIKIKIPFVPDVNYTPLMGSLISKTDFDISGNPVQRVLNTYKNIFPSSTGSYNILYGLAIQFLPIALKNPRTTIYGWKFGNYGLVKYKIVTDIQRVLSTSIETSFNPKDSTKFVSATKTYNYSDGQVSSVLQDLSDGSISKTYYKYAHDYFSQLDSYGDDNDNLDETSNLIIWSKSNDTQNKIPKNFLIEKIKTVTRDGTEKVTEGWGLNYYLIAPNCLAREYRLNIKNPIAYTSAFDSHINNDGGNYTLAFNSNYILDKTYDNYDRNFNLLQYHTNDNVYNVYLWGYNRTLLIAEIKNASYADVVSALGGQSQVNALATAASPVMTNVDALRTALPNSLVTTYTYIPLIGMTSSTDPRGVTTYYNYDNFGRLINVKKSNNILLKQNLYHYQGQQ